MQLTLAPPGPPSLDATFARAYRRDLGGGAWIDLHPGWLVHATPLFDALHGSTGWKQHRREMYGRMVDVPRLVASLPGDGPGHPMVEVATMLLSGRYGICFDRVSMALYRDGDDSVAWHGDRLGHMRSNSRVAILSLGGPRRFQLRPVGGGASLLLTLQSGDLLVMGGTCQATWEHCVPKMAWAAPRISVMFRHREPLGDQHTQPH